MSVEIRAWTGADIPVIAEMEARCFSDPWSKELLADCLRYPHYRCFLAEEGGQVCGYCCFTVLFEDAELMNIAVDERFRGRGIGKELLQTVHALAKAQGATQCFLEVRRGNAPAIALYEGQGYSSYGERKGYYADGEDALLMTAVL